MSGIQMATVAYQVMKSVNHISGRMSNASTSRDNYVIQYGTQFLYYDHVDMAISSLRDKVLYCPDTEEKKIVGDMKSKFYFLCWYVG